MKIDDARPQLSTGAQACANKQYYIITAHRLDFKGISKFDHEIASLSFDDLNALSREAVCEPREVIFHLSNM